MRLDRLVHLIRQNAKLQTVNEVKASRTLDEIIFNSRSKGRDKFTSLHRPLRLNK